MTTLIDNLKQVAEEASNDGLEWTTEVVQNAIAHIVSLEDEVVVLKARVERYSVMLDIALEVSDV